jgi:hypothetical protein
MSITIEPWLIFAIVVVGGLLGLVRQLIPRSGSAALTHRATLPELPRPDRAGKDARQLGPGP